MSAPDAGSNSEARKRAQEAQGGSEGVRLTDDETGRLEDALDKSQGDNGCYRHLIGAVEQIIAARLAAQAPGSVPVAPVPGEGANGPRIDAETIAMWGDSIPVDQFMAELERLRRWKAEALPVMAGLQELGKALDLPLGTQVTGPQAVEAVERLREALDLSEGEREDLDTGAGVLLGENVELENDLRETRARLADLRARVGALADEWAELDGGTVGGSYRAGEYAWAFAPALRALLAPEAEGSES